MQMQNIPSAFWIDVKSKIWKGQGHPDHHTVEGILEDAAACNPPSLVVFIVYDLPNRDCYALASNGEICCHYGQDVGRTKCEMTTSGPNAGFYKEYPNADCADGLTEYKDTYIDPLAQLLERFTDRVPVVLVIEPDSLPNLVTNMADKRPNAFRGCHQETSVAYEKGVRYAVERLTTTGAELYIDAGHGGWLGWANSNDDQTGRFAQIIGSLNIGSKVRGFATNVANYQPLGQIICPTPGICKGGNSPDPCCADDPCALTNEWNWGHNELNYVDVLDAKMRQAIPGFHPKFIIDTGRNGRPNARSNCGNWCNARGSGIGHVPTLDTPDPRIDAYFWLKTPGESDGCTQTLPDGNQCPRFDLMCASPDSIGSRSGEPRAPEAGLWFHYQIAELASNAAMGDTSPFQQPGQCGVVIGTTTPSPPSPTSAPTPAPTNATGSDTVFVTSTSTVTETTETTTPCTENCTTTEVTTTGVVVSRGTHPLPPFVTQLIWCAAFFSFLFRV
jgi:cellulose 1,4-beta-cellobiosidase